MKRFIILITILAANFTFTACQKDTIWVYYDETYCADKWGVANVPDKEKIKNIKKHLRKQHIQVFKVEIIGDGTLEVCKACFCKTGKRIRCKINEDDLPKAINEKFYK